MLHAIDRVLAPVTWLVAAFAVAVLVIGPELVGAEKPPPTPQQAEATATSGKEIFTTTCGGCHTLADAGTNGTVGPDLDKVLADKDEAFIKTSIVDPGAEIADGYTNGMPPGYEQQLGAAKLDALVKYLSEVTKGG